METIIPVFQALLESGQGSPLTLQNAPWQQYLQEYLGAKWKEEQPSRLPLVGLTLDTLDMMRLLKKEKSGLSARQPTAVFTKLEPCDKIQVCEHILKIYGGAFFMLSIKEHHEQRL